MRFGKIKNVLRSRSGIIIPEHFSFLFSGTAPSGAIYIRQGIALPITALVCCSSPIAGVIALPLQIGGTSDHIHILCTLPKTISLADLMEEVKKRSSKWIKTKGDEYRNFYWQDGYGGFSVGWSQVNTLKNYIKNQKEHHKGTSFIEEYKRLFDENGIEYDEKYL